MALLITADRADIWPGFVTILQHLTQLQILWGKNADYNVYGTYGNMP